VRQITKAPEATSVPNPSSRTWPRPPFWSLVGWPRQRIALVRYPSGGAATIVVMLIPAAAFRVAALGQWQPRRLSREESLTGADLGRFAGFRSRRNW